MGILSSIGKLIKSIFQKILSFLKDILKNFWWIILIVAAIYFAPMIICSAWAPGWLVTTLSYIPTGVVSAVTAFVDGAWALASSGLSSAWTAYRALDVGTQVAVAAGASMLLAPEETVEVISEVGSTIADVTTDVIGAVAGGLSSSPLLLIGAGLLLWWLLSDDDETVVVAPVAANEDPGGYGYA